jgi:signal transduction histidine kinase
VLISLGDLYRSAHLYTRIMPDDVSIGSKLLLQHTLVNDWGIPNNALDSYHAALDLARKVEAKFDMVTALLRLGETYLEDPIPGLNPADRLQQAQGYLGLAFETGKQINARQLVFETHRLLAEVYKRQGDHQLALEHFEKYHILREEVFNRESANRLRNLEIVHQVDAARKQAEISQLKNITLQEEIRQRQAAQSELEDTNRQLQDEISEKEQLISDLNAFSHMVAHDLKNPLTNIAIAAGLVKYEFERLAGPGEHSRSSENLDRIAWMVHKMNRIINELLVLASVREEDVFAEPLNMEQVVSDVERRLNHLFQESQARLTKPETWPAALGHAPWVEEIWANYISNAIQHGGSPPQLEIGAEILDSPVDLPVLMEEDAEPVLVPTTMVRFWVRDHGDGIPLDQQEFVFAPFVTRNLHTARKAPPDGPAKASGHGLGLSIVKRIVEKLDGWVGIESTGVPGEGSLFFFTLPAAPPKL